MLLLVGKVDQEVVVVEVVQEELEEEEEMVEDMRGLDLAEILVVRVIMVVMTNMDVVFPVVNQDPTVQVELQAVVPMANILQVIQVEDISNYS